MKFSYGYCGMPCALCTRYRTVGNSRCLGCSHGGYYTDVCKVHHCCVKMKLSSCGECADFPCKKLGNMSDFRDLNTGGAKVSICSDIKQNGFDRWYEDYAKKAELLTLALEKYNNGRMKRYLCELFIQRDLADIQQIMSRAESITGEPKETAQAFRKIVEEYDGMDNT